MHLTLSNFSYIISSLLDITLSLEFESNLHSNITKRAILGALFLASNPFGQILVMSL